MDYAFRSDFIVFPFFLRDRVYPCTGRAGGRTVIHLMVGRVVALFGRFLGGETIGCSAEEKPGKVLWINVLCGVMTLDALDELTPRGHLA